MCVGIIFDDYSDAVDDGVGDSERIRFRERFCDRLVISYSACLENASRIWFIIRFCIRPKRQRVCMRIGLGARDDITEKLGLGLG